MEHAKLDSRDWSRIVARLGGEAALAASALQHRAFVRAREIKSATDLLRLALMYGPGGYSLRGLAALAAGNGLADVSDVAVLGRLRASGDWLEALCQEQISRAAKSATPDVGSRPIRIVDGSRLEGPGARVWRLHLCYDATAARAVDAAITTTREGERLDRLAVIPGEIRLADRGYPTPDGIKHILKAGADLVVRLTWNSLRLTDAGGEALEWQRLFERASRVGTVDMPVLVHKAHARFEPISMRLVMIRKSPSAAARARVKARRASSKNRRRTDPRTLAAADHVILLTSLPQEAFSLEMISGLYRLRWQVELAIKRLKSILHIDRLPAKASDLAKAWLYAHLLFALMVDEITAEIGADPPRARFST